MPTQPIPGKPAPTKSSQLHKPLWEKACPHSQSLASQLPQEAFSFTSPCGRRHAHTANPWQASSHKKLSASQAPVGEGMPAQPIAGKPAPTKSFQLHKSPCGRRHAHTANRWQASSYKKLSASQAPCGRRHAHTANRWQASSHKKLSAPQAPCGRRHAHTANPWQASSHKKLSVSQVPVGEGLLTQPIPGKPAPTRSFQFHKSLWEKACSHSQSLASQLPQKAFSFTSPPVG